MKTMTCKQLGGACDAEFRAITFDEIADMIKNHAMEMIQKSDSAHLEAMNEMQKLMANPEAMHKWFEDKKKEFESMPDDN